ncbi:MAG: DMT family transporter [Candidatus Lokiarchaeota archaeon]|nr:DMT family transporter [Candidatus Harpocratesius repetitus]
MDKKSLFLAYLAILSVPISYGSFYSVFIILLSDFPVFWLCGIRMLIAFIFLLPFLKNRLKLSKLLFLHSFILAFVFFIGLLAQSFSLQFISAGTAGFVIISFIILTPFFAWLILRTVPNKKIIISIFLVICGYLIMFYNKSGQLFNFGLGELLNFIGAFVIAFQIVLFEKYAQKYDSIMITIAQFFWINIFMIITLLITKETFPFSSISLRQWALILYIGIFATITPFIAQFWAQKHITSTSTAIIISLEPIFATIFGIILLQESTSINFIFGAIVILIGILSSIILNRDKNKD